MLLHRPDLSKACKLAACTIPMTLMTAYQSLLSELPIKNTVQAPYHVVQEHKRAHAHVYASDIRPHTQLPWQSGHASKTHKDR